MQYDVWITDQYFELPRFPLIRTSETEGHKVHLIGEAVGIVHARKLAKSYLKTQRIHEHEYMTDGFLYYRPNIVMPASSMQIYVFIQPHPSKL